MGSESLSQLRTKRILILIYGGKIKRRLVEMDLDRGGPRGWSRADIFIIRHGRAEPVNYNTTAVARGDLTQTVTATGTLNPVVNVTVGSQVSGRISKLNVDFNSIVKSNEVIAEIDPSTYEAAVEQATANLANAKANLELQQVQAQRSADLFTNN